MPAKEEKFNLPDDRETLEYLLNRMLVSRSRTSSRRMVETVLRKGEEPDTVEIIEQSHNRVQRYVDELVEEYGRLKRS